MGQPENPYRTFVRRLPLSLAAAMLLWLLLLRPVLDRAVPASSELLVRAFEYPRVTRLVTADHRVEVLRADFRSGSAIPTIPITEIHFNTILLLALYLATPKPFSRTQLERLFMGWCVLFAIQALNLTFHVKLIYAMGLGEWSLQTYSDLARDVFSYLQYFTDLPARFAAPFLIWLGFNWDVVMRIVGAQRTGDAPSRRRTRGTPRT